MLAVARTLGFGPRRPGRRARAPGGADSAGAQHLAAAASGADNAPHATPAPIAGAAGGAPNAAAATGPHATERAGLITMLAIVVIFGVSSLIDWTWFVPGVAIPALVCAGWVAGRGPLEAPIGQANNRRRMLTSPGAAAAGFGVVAATIAAAWFVWQPLHSQDAFDAAITAMSNGNSTAALADAQSAAASNPVSVEPLWELSGIYSARHDPADARQELIKATTVQPSNAATWEQLGEFDLAQRQPIVAVLELQTAKLLDQSSAAVAQQSTAAEAALTKAGLSAPPAPAASS